MRCWFVGCGDNTATPELSTDDNVKKQMRASIVMRDSKRLPNGPGIRCGMSVAGSA